MNDEIHIEIERVNKSFGAVSVLKDVSLKIPRGSFTTLLGESGCGKTTMLRSIAGLYEIDSGAIRFSGRDVTNLPPRDRNSIMVFQDYALFPHLSVEDNVAYGLKIRGMSKSVISEKLDGVMKYLGIEPLRSRAVTQLSGGQQQRVALARALVMEPEVLLLDEPLSNLDPKLRVSIRAELRRIQQDLGITTVFVTHDQAEALSMSDQIAVMHQGRIAQIGSPVEIYRHPDSHYVADFIGTANIIRGRFVETNGATSGNTGDADSMATSEAEKAPVAFEFLGLKVMLHSGTPARKPGTEASVCVRPEAIGLHLSGRSNAGREGLDGRVIQTMFEGSHLRTWVDIEGTAFVVDSFDGPDELSPGTRVTLTFDAARMHFL